MSGVPAESGTGCPQGRVAVRPGQSAAARGVDIANVAADKAVVAARQLDLDYTKIKAPVSGRVSRYLVTKGNLIQSADQANVTLLTTIVSVDPMYAYFDVDERTVQRVRQWLREGKAKSAADAELPVALGLATEEGFPHQGTINFVDNQVNPKTGTLRVRGMFPNKDETLGAGFFARVRLPLGPPHPALLVSDRAWTATRARKSSTSSTTRTRSFPAPFGSDAARRAAGDRGRPEAGRAGDRQRPATGPAGHHGRAEARRDAQATIRNPNIEIRNKFNFEG